MILYKRTEQWQKDGGQFIPQPAKWLRARSWDDDPLMGGNGRARPVCPCGRILTFETSIERGTCGSCHDG
ncbi:MAG: hypothetical protein HKM86_05465 [Deltaproteobacteria bacterium]|nr:hypothetical protein [Deltaproteobacteria bacterium]